MKKVIMINTKTRTIRVENADKNIDWITVKGTHVPIEKGQSKSSAVKSFVESKRGESKQGSYTKIPKGASQIGPVPDHVAERHIKTIKEQQPAKKERSYWRGPREDEDAYFERREKTLTEARKLDKVADWFAKAYKGAYGAPTNKDITFDELADGILSGKINDFYEAVGTGESETREKIFEELSERTGRPYDDFYDAWLHGGQKGTASRKAKAKEDYKKYNKMLDNPNLAPDIRKLIMAARDRAKKEAGKIKETDEEIAHRLTRDYPESFGYDD